MLALTGVPGDQFLIGENLIVIILGRGNHPGETKLGFNIPGDVNVKRIGKSPEFLSRKAYGAQKLAKKLIAAGGPQTDNRELTTDNCEKAGTQ